MPDGEGRRVDFDVDDRVHREFRAEAERLVELWRSQQVDLTEVDLTEAEGVDGRTRARVG